MHGAASLSPLRILWFVIINRRGNCGLVCPDEEESKVDVRETVPPSRRLRT